MFRRAFTSVARIADKLEERPTHVRSTRRKHNYFDRYLRHQFQVSARDRQSLQPQPEHLLAWSLQKRLVLQSPTLPTRTAWLSLLSCALHILRLCNLGRVRLS